jgi:hypothetical protein
MIMTMTMMVMMMILEKKDDDDAADHPVARVRTRRPSRIQTWGSSQMTLRRYCRSLMAYSSGRLSWARGRKH